jgi:rhomboid protease GluP
MSLTRAPVAIALLILNIVIFIVDQLSPVDDLTGLHTLMALGAIDPQKVAAGEYYRIITSGFLQFNLQHIGFNMYALAQAGMVVENFYGSLRFILIYMIALIAGGLVAYETTIGTPSITAGASGAIMGLFGAMAALGLKTPRLRQALLQWALFPIVATLAVGFSTRGISNADHIGGLIAGAIAAYVLPASRMYEDA